MTAKMLLESEKYVTDSLLMLYISDFQNGLKNVLDYLKPPAPADDPVEIVTRKNVIPCVEELVEDLDNR